MGKSQRAPIEQTALLVVDVQDSFKFGPRWDRRSNPRFEENLSRLIAAFRASDRPVVFVLHSDPDPGFEVGSPHYKLMNFLERRPTEPLVHKTTRNCFTSTNLLPLLLERGVRRVVVTGIQTEQCCETTTRVGADLGFDMDFVTEATLTFPIPKSDDPGAEELSVDDVIERTEYVLRDRFARIATVDDLVSELQASQNPSPLGL